MRFIATIEIDAEMVYEVDESIEDKAKQRERMFKAIRESISTYDGEIVNGVKLDQHSISVVKE